MKGKQANGGGAANCGNSGGGGGGNAGTGGIGGNQYNGCGGFDERGLGGLNLTTAATSLFMGGGGGGGFRDNGQVATNGGNGGGIIFIKANQIICNNKVVTAAGGNVTIIANDEGAGGGGGGGTIFIACNNYVGNLTVNTSGGFGGSNFNTIFPGNCHGPGGGGGGGLYAFSSPALPIGITYQTFGGAAGTVNNPSSPCFGTTFGAAAGLTGSTLPSLPTSTLYAVPTLSVTGTTTLCAGLPTILTAGGGTTYTWSPAGSLSSSSSYSVLATPPVTTTYSISSGSGICLTSSVITVSVTPSPTVTITASTNSLCVGQSSTLTAIGATTYSWFPSSVSLSTTSGPVTVAAPNSTSTYTVIGSNGVCPNSSIITITVFPTPTITVNSPSICSGNSATLTATGATSYTWSSGSIGNPITVTPTSTSIYTVTGSNGGVCSSTFTTAVTVVNFPSVLGSITTDIKCFGISDGSIVINAIDVDNFLWIPIGATTSSVSGLAAGNYTCVLIANPSCSIVTTYSITQPTAISGLITFTNTTCGLCNGIADITVTGGTGAYSYNWLPSAQTQSTAINLCANSHTVIITDANNCISTYTADIMPSTIFQASLTASNTEIYAGEPVSLIGSAGASFTWSPINDLSCIDCISTVATPSNDITYCIDVTSVDGCVDSACVEIIIKCGEVFVPNAFSPNNDGHNDELTVYGNCIKDIVFRIFDRWGEMVYESFDPKEKWDGKYKGYEVTAGVFVYQFTAKLKSGEFITKKGNITVVK